MYISLKGLKLLHFVQNLLEIAYQHIQKIHQGHWKGDFKSETFSELQSLDQSL